MHNTPPGGPEIIKLKLRKLANTSRKSQEHRDHRTAVATIGIGTHKEKKENIIP